MTSSVRPATGSACDWFSRRQVQPAAGAEDAAGFEPAPLESEVDPDDVDPDEDDAESDDEDEESDDAAGALALELERESVA